MKKLVAVFIITMFIFGCSGGGGLSDTATSSFGENTVEEVETTIKTSITNEEGVAEFVDSSTREDVNVYVEDIDGNPILGVSVEFWDSDDYELFIMTDPNSEYLPVLEIYPHNSDHLITMYLPEEEGGNEITELPIDSDKGQAMENFLSDTAGERIYKGRFTPEELDETDEIRMMIFGPVPIIGGVSSFFTLVSKINDFIEKTNEIFNFDEGGEPEFYDTYILIPNSSITTTLPWFVEVVDDDTIPNDDTIPDEDVICTDTDGDEYYIEGGICGEIDCNDNNYYINPGAEEVCDGIDNNCDGIVDEGCSGIPNAPSNFIATDMGSHLAYVEWQDNSDNEDGFRMEAYIDVINAGGWGWHGSDFEESGVYVQFANSLYEWQFRIRSFNNEGNSEWVYTTLNSH